MHDLRSGAGLVDHHVGQIVDADLVLGPDVEDVPDRGGVVEERDQGPNGVVHVTEAPPLLSASVDRDVVPLESLADEPRDDHAVRASLARPAGIEEANHDGRGSPLPPVRVCQDLVHRLRGAVRPPCFERRTKDPVGILSKWSAGVLAIDLGRGGHQDLPPEFRACLEHVLGTSDVIHQGLERFLHDQVDPHGSSQVHHDVCVGDELPNQALVQDRSLLQDKRVPGEHAIEVLEIPGGQVVEAHHTASSVDKSVSYVGADESSCACHEVLGGHFGQIYLQQGPLCNPPVNPECSGRRGIVVAAGYARRRARS